MPNAKNLGVGLIVTALIVGIVGKEAYSTGDWKRVAADFTGRSYTTPFNGQFSANRCGGDKLGRATKGTECVMDFDMEMTINGKTTHVGADGNMDVNGVQVQHEANMDKTTTMPEFKQVGPSTLTIGENLELTISNERFVASRSLQWGFGGGWGGMWNAPYTPTLAYIFNPPIPPPTPSPSFQCALHEELKDTDTVSCLAGAVQSGVIAAGVALTPFTAGLSFLITFIISSVINFLFTTTLTGVSTLDCAKLAALEMDDMSEGAIATKICNPIVFSLDWEMPYYGGGF